MLKTNIKKCISAVIITVLLTALIFSVNTFAENFSISINSPTVTEGNNVSVTIKSSIAVPGVDMVVQYDAHTGNNRLFRLECRARTRRGGLLRFPRRVGFLNRGLLDWRSLFRRSVTGTIRARGLRAGFEFVICHSLTSFNFGVLHKNER